MDQTESRAGHRARLRKRFSANPAALSEVELVELLLTYAIPRQDVVPQATHLIGRFGSLDGVLGASTEELASVAGIGEHSGVLIRLVGRLTRLASGQTQQVSVSAQQPALLEVEPTLGPLFEGEPQLVEPEISTYANDEVANALRFIPQVERFATCEAFKEYLCANLPYNSESTRRRRANYILLRFFPAERLSISLAYYAARCTSQEDLKPVVFYHVLKAERLAAKVAEELVWPAVPVGRVEREEMREFVQGQQATARPRG